MHIYKLSDYFEITSSKRVFKSEWTQDGIPFYRAREIVKISKNEKFKDPIFISNNHYQEVAKKYGVPKIGDLLVTGVGTLGISLIIENEKPFYFKDGNIIWFKKKEEINSKYVQHYLNSPIVQKMINNKIGATVKTFTISDANNLQIPVPSLQEQEKIVERLDEVFENISKKLKIDKLRKEELNTLSKSIYDELFNFNSNNLTTLSNLVEFENGDRGRNYPSKKYRVKSGIPFINAGNFNLEGEISEEKMEYISDEHYNKLSGGKVRKNDFLLCIRGSLGKFALNNRYGKAAIASSLVIIRPNKLDNIEMLDKYFRSSLFKKQITEKSGGTAQPNLGANQLKDFLIPSSLSKEALYRARKIDILLKQYLENNQKVIEKVNLLKTSLLNKEFSYE